MVDRLAARPNVDLHANLSMLTALFAGALLMVLGMIGGAVFVLSLRGATLF